MTEIRPIAVPKQRAGNPEPEWEGRPAWRSLAVYFFRIRWIAVYFGALSLAAGLTAILAGVPAALALGSQFSLFLSASLVCSLVLLAAYLIERTTRYTLTDTHLVMRYGLAIPATLAIPLTLIEHVALRVRSDHTGDIALRLSGSERISSVKLFPHARSWRPGRAEPMLRSVPHAALAGGIIANAVAAAARGRSLAA